MRVLVGCPTSDRYDYFFSLEQDVIANPDTLATLISHSKDIVCAYYGKRKDLIITEKGKKTHLEIDIPVIFLDEDDGVVRQANAFEVRDKGLMEIGAAGLGCMLISAQVLQSIKFRWAKAFDDMLFCEDASNLGYKVFLDSDHTVSHLHRPW